MAVTVVCCFSYAHVKFIYSEKVVKFEEILLLSFDVIKVKSKLRERFLQIFAAASQKTRQNLIFNSDVGS